MIKIVSLNILKIKFYIIKEICTLIIQLFKNA